MRLSRYPTLYSVSKLLCLAPLSLILFASHSPSQLSLILNSGQLNVVMSNPPSGEFGKQSGDTGFDFRLLNAFAEHLGVGLHIIHQPNLSTLQTMIVNRQVDMGASHSSDLLNRKPGVATGSAYLRVKQQLIYKDGKNKPKSFADVANKTTSVEFASRQAASLKLLQRQYSQLKWHERLDENPIGLVEKVQTGELDYAIVNSNIFDISRSIYPQVSVAFDISLEQEVAWMFRDVKDKSLIQAANNFMANINNNGTLEQLTQEHYQHIKKVDYTEAMAFYRRMQTRLPKWQTMLKDSGSQYNIDWHLLAAISYQESHWNDKARSYTGVRGLMMLTKATAKELGIKNRIDPSQSIDGGARYFKKIFKRLPASIQGEDRTWFTLASYNVGYGHVEDARILTQRQGGDPNSWDAVVKRLPLLSQKKYYKTLRRGYARGREPVKYVANIRQYYDILIWQDELAQRQQAEPEPKTAEEVQTVKLKHDDRDLRMSLL